MADQDLLETVWGETAGLKPKDGKPETLARLQAVVAKLAATAKNGGLPGKLQQKPAPRADDKDAVDAYNAASATVDAVQSGNPAFVPPLPARAALWEVDGNGTLLLDRPPNSAAWIAGSDATPGGDFISGTGAGARTWRLFESAKAPADGEPVYVSGYTGSGTPPPMAVRPWYKSPNWAIGLFGGALFFLAAFNLQWTASSFSQAYDVLAKHQPGQTEAFARDYANNPLPLPPCPADAREDQKKFCETPDEVAGDKKGPALQTALDLHRKKLLAIRSDGGPACLVRLTALATSEKAVREKREAPALRSPADTAADTLCLSLLTDAVLYSARNLVVKSDSMFGSAVQAVLWWVLSWHVPTTGTQTVSLGMPTSLMMAGVVLVLIGLGRGVNGTPLGALISPNGRYSLALAQVTFWTVLVLTSVIAIAIFNGGLVSEMVRYFPKIVKGIVEPTAVANGFFPVIPDGIWGVLGISFGSTMVSTLIKSLKGEGTADSATQVSDDNTRQTGGTGTFKSRVIAYDPAHRASIADWFLGEDADNINKIDISRVQMVLITAGLLVTYGNAIFAAIRDLAPQEILLAIQNVDVLVATLPPVGATMAIMLAVSHATYLVAKAAPSANPTPPK
jgi:hypothetical protein